MYKVLTEVYVPSVGETFEIYLPAESRVSEVLPLIQQAVAELTAGAFRPNGEVVLCERESGMVYNINMTVEEIGLKNGSRLMIV
ncbi:MAG: methyltransferase [Lachnospiraceae bacterium]|nr:methyltransferase [Lachnospiraceae bacterium]